MPNLILGPVHHQNDLSLNYDSHHGHRLLQAIVKTSSGNPCIFVVMYLLLSKPMTSFMINHVFLRILRLLLSDHIQNINRQLIVIVIPSLSEFPSLLEFPSCGIK